MNRTYLLLAAGLACQAALMAQTQPEQTRMVTSLQQAGTFAAGGRGGGRGGAIRPETGKPFSATVITQTSQTLSDGTRIDHSTTVRQYRDAAGRTRTETLEPDVSPSGPVASIVIHDTVAGVMYRLDPSNKTVTKVTLAGAGVAGAVVSAGGGGGGGFGGGGARGRGGFGGGEARGGVIAAARAGSGGRGRGGMSGDSAGSVAIAQADGSVGSPVVEDLGAMNINGVPARGTRTTVIIPVGAIGNDREFRSVSERWFSSDLNMLIKSVSTDPRFGTTTYEMTNISRQPPDPSLFQPPADYKAVN